MGYRPKGCKELDTTEVTEHARTAMTVLVPVSLWGSGDYFRHVHSEVRTAELERTLT